MINSANIQYSHCITTIKRHIFHITSLTLYILQGDHRKYLLFRDIILYTPKWKWLIQCLINTIVVPKHFDSLGSGIHCPVLAHLAAAGPSSINPEEHLKVIFAPSNAMPRSLYPETVMLEPSEVKGDSHLATIGY